MKSLEETRSELDMYRRMEFERDNPAPKPSCETCRFHVKNLGFPDREEDGFLGTCHRRSPEVGNRWPAVTSAEWCGEYEKSLTPPPGAVA